MAELHAEPREERGRGGYWGLLLAVLAAWIAGMIVFGIFMPGPHVSGPVLTTPGVTGAGPVTPTPTRPSATEQPAQPQTLDQFLSQTNLPRQFTYGGLRWQAQDFGQYGMRSGIQMATIGPAISGHKLYYEKGTPTSPYETLYLRGEDQYRDWFVRYSSVGPAQGTGATTRQGPSAMGNQTPSAGPMHQGVSLTQMLNNTGLPMQFTYNNRTWKATDFGDYSQSGAQLSDTGDSAGGHALYYQMGSSTSPYNTLYMKAGSAYPNTWVKYTPTGK